MQFFGCYTSYIYISIYFDVLFFLAVVFLEMEMCVFTFVIKHQ